MKDPFGRAAVLRTQRGDSRWGRQTASFPRNSSGLGEESLLQGGSPLDHQGQKTSVLVRTLYCCSGSGHRLLLGLVNGFLNSRKNSYKTGCKGVNLTIRGK